MDTPVNQEVVNDTAKLIMHRLIARSLGRDPSLRERARVSLATMASHFPALSFGQEWDKLLRLPTNELRRRLVDRDPEMKRLRLSSPFVIAEGIDFTQPALRRRIRRAARRLAERALQAGSTPGRAA